MRCWMAAGIVEKAFSDVSNALITHLKPKPEVRDLLDELHPHGRPSRPEAPKA